MPPLLIAGPIRRTEPVLVTVWVALSAPATVEVRIWDGLVHDATSAPLFSTELPALAPLANTGSTVRIGDQLHIAVVTFKLPAPHALLPNRTYSYNVILTRRVRSRARSQEHSAVAGRTDQWQSSPGLGYEPGFYPHFNCLHS